MNIALFNTLGMLMANYSIHSKEERSSDNYPHVNFADRDFLSDCAQPNTFPIILPETHDELDATCLFLYNYINCMRDFYLNRPGSFDIEEKYQRTNATLHLMCEEGTSFHERLRKNLVCIKEVLYLHQHHCDRKRMSIFQAYLDYEEKKEILGDALYEWDEMQCLMHAWNVGCYIKNVHICGREAVNVVTKIVAMSKYNIEGCEGDRHLKAKSLLWRLHLVHYQRETIKQMLYLRDDLL